MSESISLLIIDDHPMVRAGLRSLLTAPGINIVGERNERRNPK